MGLAIGRLTFIGLSIVTLAMNLIPIYGVINWGWAARDIILLYWVETVIVGLIYILRIWTKVHAEDPWPKTWLGRIFVIIMNVIARTIMCIPFVVHFGGFCFLLGMFLLEHFFSKIGAHGHDIFKLVYDEGLVSGLYLAAFGILVSHLLHLAVFWFANGRFLKDKAMDGILRTYVRIVALFTTVFILAELANRQESAFMAVLALVGCKILFDLYVLITDSKKGTESSDGTT